MTPRAHKLLAASLVLSLVAVGGCKSKAAEDSGFLNQPQTMSKQETLPFDRAWLEPGWNGPDRNSIVIAPVDTRFVKESKWYRKAQEKGKVAELDKDLRELAEFTREEFQQAFRKDKNKRFSVVNSPQTGSVVFELAIVEVEPNKGALGMVGLATLVVAAPIGLGILAKEGAKGGVAIEGRIKDAQTGEVVAMFADREHGKFAPVNVARATSFGEVQRSIREWAEQWVKIANAPPGEKVKDSKAFTLRPW